MFILQQVTVVAPCHHHGLQMPSEAVSSVTNQFLQSQEELSSVSYSEKAARVSQSGDWVGCRGRSVGEQQLHIALDVLGFMQS